MNQGRHAAEDGSFGRSTGLALGRGLGLLAVAVIIGIVLMHTLSPAPAAQAGPPPTVQSPSNSTPSGSNPSTSTPSSSVPSTTVAPTTTLAPSKVAVLVANGTSQGLGATHLSAALSAAGYHTLPPTNTTSNQTASGVYFASGYDQAAATIAGLLQLGPSTVQPIPSSLPVPTVTGANVVVIEGPTLAQAYTSSTTLPAATTPGSSSSSTSAGSTTSTTAGSTSTSG